MISQQIVTQSAPKRINLVKAQSALCSRRFYRFVQTMWPVIIPEPPIWNWHIEYLCDELQTVIERVVRREAKMEDIIINIPPGTSKSTVLSIMLPAWAWSLDPTLRILSLSFSDDAAMDSAMKSRDIITSDLYQQLFPYVNIRKDQDSKTHYQTTKNGQRYATGILGSITGKHFHIILVDDPINPKKAASEAECIIANNAIDSTIYTRKIDKAVAVTVLIMQRLSENDPTAHMLDKAGKEIKHICLPAELLDGPRPEQLAAKYVDGLLDPVRLSKKILMEARTDLGLANYTGQFAQRPAPAGGLVWQKEWFRVVPDHLWPDRKMMTSLGTDWDTAYTEKEENAANAYITAGKIGNNIYIDDLGFDWLEFPALLRWMKTKQAPHYIESKASGKSIKSTLHSQGIIAIETKVEGGMDKVARAKMASPTAEAGFVFIKASLINILLNDSRQGILFFPKGKYKDLADALAQSLLRLGKQGRYRTTTGREDDDF